jgi:hypothetical protein
VKRNSDKFPSDFMFRLTPAEAAEMRRSRSQVVILKRGHNIKYLPYAFTEHGAIMAADLLDMPGCLAVFDEKCRIIREETL